MRRKFLSVVLCVCMMLTMAPFAFAEGDSGDSTEDDCDTSATTTLQSQIDQITSSSTITLNQGSSTYTEDITIPSGKNVTIDLNGNSLSNTNNNKATLSVSGTATIKNGTITGGTGYYNIEVKNGGSLTLENVTATAGNTDSSMIDNWGTLTINSGTYTGGLNVVKSEEGSTLSISGGKFELNYATSSGYTGVILSAGTTKISSGEFIQNATTSRWGHPQVVLAMQVDNYTSKVEISGGTFKNNKSNESIFHGSGKANSSNFAVSGGSFNKSVPSSYLVTGKVCKKNSSTGMYELVSGATGVTLSETEKTIKVGESFNLVATLTPDNADVKAVEWQSSNKKIASVEKTGTVKGVAVGDVTITATPNAGGATPATCTVHVYDEVAQIGNVKYPTFEEALEKAQPSDTITLLKNVSLKATAAINKSITLDLGGYTLKGPKTTVKPNNSDSKSWYEYIALKITEGTVALKNGKISGRVNVYDAANVTLEKDATITNKGFNSSTDGYGIVIWGDGTYGQDGCKTPVLNLYGKVNVTGAKGVAISTNGSDASKPVINIYNGAEVTSEKCSGVYLPSGALTVSGGTITGATGIYFKSTDMTISGGTIVGNGPKADYKFYGNGANTTGDALVIDNCNYPGGIGNVKLTGGNFKSVNADAVGSYAGNGQTEPLTSFITGGLFSSDPTPYCGTKDGKQLTGVASNDSTYPYTVGTKPDNSKPATVDSATVPAKAASSDATVQEAANSISGAKLENSASMEAAVKDIANNNKFEATSNTTGKSTVLSDLQKVDSSVTSSDNVSIVYQTYIDITVTDAKKDTDKFSELAVNLTPMYRVVATKQDNVTSDATLVTEGDGQNAVVIQAGQPLNNVPVNNYEVKLALPSGFASKDAKLSIKHTKGDGSVEYYTGTVSTEGEGDSAKAYVTFTTNGFSPFVIYAASANVASIGNNVYPSFQAAVDAAQDGQEITLLKSGDVSATMTGSSKTIKVKRADTVSGNVNVTVNSEKKTLDSTTTEVTFTYTRPSSGGPGSSGGSISTPTTYAVNVNAATNGAVAADKKTASKGTTVTVTASPSKGYVVDAVKVVDKDGKDVAVTEKDGKYVFTMPASAVTVTGSFKAETPAPAALPFTDVKSGNWFYDAVKYAYAQGLMTGTSATTFAPNGTMNRAMIVTVLYRLEKSPAVTGASKFTDVPAGQWYSDAVAWAAANKIVNGYDETTFGPMNAVTREQMAAILFRYEQVKGLENVTLEENLNRFPDQNKISAYAIPALQWAVGQKIINGNADGTLDPTGTATRAQVAQIFTNLLNQ